MKKLLKRIALFLVLTPIVVLVLVAIAYGIFSMVAVGGESSPHQAYLKQHMEKVSLENSPAFSIFDSTFYQNQIFFLGEAHGCAKPQQLDFALMKHLNKKVNMRHYLAEVDYSQAHFLNEYLRTGNEALLSYAFQFWVQQNAQWGNQNFYDKLRKIRAFNQTLPLSRRIIILGVDRIQDMNALQRHLQGIIAELPITPNTPLLKKLRHIASADTLDTDSFVNLAQQLLPTLAKDSSATSVQFDLRHILQNVVYMHQKIKRDSVMYLNLNKLVQQKNLQKEKLYGMWGLFHTIPVQVERGIPFAYLLQSSASPYRNKAVSIGVYTLDSESMMPTAGLPTFMDKGQRYVSTTMTNNDGPMVFVNGIKDLRAVSRANSITIFRTNAPDSPYYNSHRLATFKVLFPNQSIKFAGENPGVAKIFQYICLVRNSAALTPLPVH